MRPEESRAALAFCVQTKVKFWFIYVFVFLCFDVDTFNDYL